MESIFPPPRRHPLRRLAELLLPLLYTYAAVIFVTAGDWPGRGRRRG